MNSVNVLLQIRPLQLLADRFEFLRAYRLLLLLRQKI
ncbi:hypothetical protein SAMN05421510_10774 [Nitrosomonas ureae]|uniref:Uncharacterized protein n=1 Tax=Nitrosomonas ureae TaxID=44577 RepID=A0A1H9GUT0_9PROT|nr:hypothetical protein C8R28_101923 [Nitrosomonas ureae]PXX14665.1 hypothetical protein C8R27_11419 [Nitrosomonas ureae]SDU18995.1 hypothetical protein SAMN05216406_1329 [Nitrosomonas ureae]SEQ53815.1 hypothetical protein SAMN05421510_10774 [Nitrosomonas ureae]SOD20772.1 hypothetical protein SAMN06297164_2827 [Nitrosomonas ureae]